MSLYVCNTLSQTSCISWFSHFNINACKKKTRSTKPNTPPHTKTPNSKIYIYHQCAIFVNNCTLLCCSYLGLKECYSMHCKRLQWASSWYFIGTWIICHFAPSRAITITVKRKKPHNLLWILWNNTNYNITYDARQYLT